MTRDTRPDNRPWSVSQRRTARKRRIERQGSRAGRRAASSAAPAKLMLKTGELPYTLPTGKVKPPKPLASVVREWEKEMRPDNYGRWEPLITSMGNPADIRVIEGEERDGHAGVKVGVTGDDTRRHSFRGFAAAGLDWEDDASAIGNRYRRKR